MNATGGHQKGTRTFSDTPYTPQGNLAKTSAFP